MIQYNNDTVYFKSTDEKIKLKYCKKSYSPEEAQSIISKNNDIDYNKRYLNNKRTCFKKLKEVSLVYNLLIKNKKLLDKYSIEINKAVLVLSSLVNFLKDKNLQLLPDRFLKYRSELSRTNICNLIIIFKHLGLIKTKKSNSYSIYVQLTDTVLKDPFILVMATKNSISDSRKLTFCEQKFGSFYFDPLTHETELRRLRLNILGLAKAYTDLKAKDILKKSYDDNKIYGKRIDISYLEVPVHLCASILHIKELDITKYLSKLCMCSNYISKHDKFYVETNNIDNYYNVEYKKCDLDNDINKLTSDHPIITKYSYILYNKNFEKTKTGKYVYENLEYYKELIIKELEVNSLNNNDNSINDNDNELNYDKTMISKALKFVLKQTGYEALIYDNGTSIIDISDLKNKIKEYQHYRNRIRIRFNKLSLKKAISLVPKIMNKINDSNTLLSYKVQNYYDNLIKKLLNWISYKLNTIKNNALYNNYKELIIDYNYSYCFNFKKFDIL